MIAEGVARICGGTAVGVISGMAAMEKGHGLEYMGVLAATNTIDCIVNLYRINKVQNDSC